MPDGRWEGRNFLSNVSLINFFAAAFVFGIFCLCLPLLAFIVLNQDWQIYIAVIDVYYKPWRIFIAVCGSLSAICSICLFFLPESPKFVFATVSLIRLAHCNEWISSMKIILGRWSEDAEDSWEDVSDQQLLGGEVWRGWDSKRFRLHGSGQRTQRATRMLLLRHFQADVAPDGADL